MSGRPLRMVIAGGGTGGHVLPAIATIDVLRQRGMPLELLWIGSARGVEAREALAAAIPFRAIQTGKLRRYLAWKTIADTIRLPIGTVQAFLTLRRFRPDVIFSTGGFVSVPTVLAGRRYPTLTHEQTATLGLANRINARSADVLAISYASQLEQAESLHNQVILTGNPVRSSLRNGDRQAALTRFGFQPDLPVLYVTGGARGSSPINHRIQALLPGLLHHCQIVHQLGPADANNDLKTMEAELSRWPEELRKRYVPVDFVQTGLADLYAATDLVLGRAGAGTVAELAYVGLPAIFIPLPGASGDEQTRNAEQLAQAGAAMVLQESDATPEVLQATILQLLADPERRSRMANAGNSLSTANAAEKLADALLDLAGWT